MIAIRGEFRPFCFLIGTRRPRKRATLFFCVCHIIKNFYLLARSCTLRVVMRLGMGMGNVKWEWKSRIFVSSFFFKGDQLYLVQYS